LVAAGFHFKKACNMTNVTGFLIVLNLLARPAVEKEI